MHGMIEHHCIHPFMIIGHFVAVPLKNSLDASYFSLIAVNFAGFRNLGSQELWAARFAIKYQIVIPTLEDL